YAPLFQVLFVLQNAPLPDLALPGLAAKAAGLDSGTESFDLTLTLAEEEEGALTGALSFSTDLFERPTAERLFGWFGALLAAAVADPERPISPLPLLGEEERRQLLALAAGAALEPIEACLQELVAAQAARTPGATALVVGTERLAYGELAARAAALAAALRGLGVGPEERV